MGGDSLKKYLYTFLIVIIIIGSLLLINNLGIISFRQWGENIIQSTPFVKEYVRTAEEYEKVVEKNQKLQEENENLKEELNNKNEQISKLESKIAELGATNQGLISQIEEIQQKEESEQANFEKLLKIYENMNPESAANILNSLEREYALRILKGLSDKTAATILESMEVEKAVEFSQDLQN